MNTPPPPPPPPPPPFFFETQSPLLPYSDSKTHLVVLREDVKLQLDLLPGDGLDEELAVVRLEKLGAALTARVVVRWCERHKGILQGKIGGGGGRESKFWKLISQYYCTYM